jgi:hypothetical protein
MTEQLLDRIFAELSKVVGPIVANLVLGIVIREAKLDFTEEQLAQLRANRESALASRLDDIRRSA